MQPLPPKVNPHATFCHPPLDGSLNILEMIEFHAVNSPDHPVFQYESAEGVTTKVVWTDVVRVYHHAAGSIKKQLLASKSTPNVIGILAAFDSITYCSTIVGIMRAGFIPFPISSRNSPSAVVHLLNSTGCKDVIVSADQNTQNLVKASIALWRKDNPESKDITIMSAPSFSELFSIAVEIYDDEPLPTIEPSTPCIILHSSGSVAFPKPITLTYRMVFEHGLLPHYGEMDLCGHVFSGQPIPMYHLMGFIIIPWTTMLGMTVAVFPPGKMVLPSPDVVLASAVATKCTLLYCVPTFLETWARKASNIEILKSFSAVLYAGGPLQKSVGDMLVKEGINVGPMFGLTEIGSVSMIVPKQPPKEGWDWFRTSKHVDIGFVPVEELDGVFRMVIKESPLKTPAVLNTEHNGTRAYDTNDLVIRHPTNPELWKVYGRHDDQIMHSTGEKTNPVPIEAILLKDSRIASAVMFGRSKFQAGVIVMPSPEYHVDPSDAKQIEEFRNLIWDTVVLANESAPQHSRIFKEMILVADRAKPFEFTAKMTPRRAAVLKAYETEIENIYKAAEESSRAEIPIPQSWELSEIRKFVHEVVRSVLEKQIADEDNLFNVGCDSLSATSIRNSILRAIRQSRSIPLATIRALPPDFVFMFPSIALLSSFVYGITLSSIPVDEEDIKLDDDEQFAWPEPGAGPAVLQVKKGKREPPLIIIHGASGTATVFMTLSDKFNSAIWLTQVTQETPLTSVVELSQFYMAKIKKLQPHGPYRICGFSASSLITYALVKAFEDNGDVVAQFALLDHFPAFYLRNIDPNTFDIKDPIQSKKVVDDSIERVALLMMNGDPGNPLTYHRHRKGEELLKRMRGLSSTPDAEQFYKVAGSLITMSIEFLLDRRFFEEDSTGKKKWSKDLLRSWMTSIKAPLDLYVAVDGLISLAPPERRAAFADLGAREYVPNAQIISIPGRHMDFFEDDACIKHLQRDYVH